MSICVMYQSVLVWIFSKKYRHSLCRCCSLTKEEVWDVEKEDLCDRNYYTWHLGTTKLSFTREIQFQKNKGRSSSHILVLVVKYCIKMCVKRLLRVYLSDIHNMLIRCHMKTCCIYRYIPKHFLSRMVSREG